MVKAIDVEIAQYLAKSVRNVGKIIISKQYARVVKNTIQVDPGQRKAKLKASMNLMKRENESMDDLADQFQSLFCHDMTFTLIQSTL